MAKSLIISLAGGESLVITQTINETYIDVDVNVDEIIRVINGATMRPRFRIFVLHSDETADYPIDISDVQQGGSFSENYQNGQRRSLSFSLNNEGGNYTPSINTFWANNKFSFEEGLELDDGSVVWFKKGVYTITTISPSHTNDNKLVSVELADKFAILEGKLGTLDTTFEIPTGSDIQQIILDILSYSKGNGEVLDPMPLIYHSSFKGKKTQVTITKEAGDTFGSILLELATQLSAEIFYNSNGNLTVMPLNEVIHDPDKPVIYQLTDTNGDFANLDFSFNLSEVINRVVVIGGTVNSQVFKAVAANDNVESPLCYQRIGYRTGSPINDANIVSDILAQERADYELRNQTILKSSSSQTITFNPLLEVNNLIEVNSEFYNLQQEKFLLQGISGSIGFEGTMSISTCNIQNLPFLSK